MHLSCFGINLKIGFWIVDYFHAAQDKDQWQALMCRVK